MKHHEPMCEFCGSDNTRQIGGHDEGVRQCMDCGAHFEEELVQHIEPRKKRGRFDDDY